MNIKILYIEYIIFRLIKCLNGFRFRNRTFPHNPLNGFKLGYFVFTLVNHLFRDDLILPINFYLNIKILINKLWVFDILKYLTHSL